MTTSTPRPATKISEQGIFALYAVPIDSRGMAATYRTPTPAIGTTAPPTIQRLTPGRGTGRSGRFDRRSSGLVTFQQLLERVVVRRQEERVLRPPGELLGSDDVLQARDGEFDPINHEEAPLLPHRVERVSAHR